MGISHFDKVGTVEHPGGRRGSDRRAVAGGPKWEYQFASNAFFLLQFFAHVLWVGRWSAARGLKGPVGVNRPNPL